LANFKVDEIVEHILTLRDRQLHTFNDYTKNGNVRVGKSILEDSKAVKIIVDCLSELLINERDILSKSGNADNEGTNVTMSDFISEREKNV